MLKQAEERLTFHEDFERALAFATRLHAGQTRKQTDIPYISHLLAVASLVLEHGGGRDEAIAALLHDSIEDQGGEYPGGAAALRGAIETAFGRAVAEIVEGCTDADTVPKPPWRERKERYLVHLHSASASVRLVACADKLHNARAIVADLRIMGRALYERFNGGRTGTLWYYEALARVFDSSGPAALAGELGRTVETMRLLSQEG